MIPFQSDSILFFFSGICRISPAGLGFNRYLRRFLLAADPSGSAFLPFPFSVKYPGVSRRFASELILSHPPHCCQYFPAFFFWNIPHRTDPMRMTVLNVSHTDKTVNTSPRFFSPFFSHRVRIPLIPLSFSRYYNVLYQEKIISRTIQCFFFIFAFSNSKSHNDFHHHSYCSKFIRVSENTDQTHFSIYYLIYIFITEQSFADNSSPSTSVKI